MNQTRLGSLIEAAFNTLIGFFISFIAWPIGAWLCNIETGTTGQHAGIVGFFTVLSVARSYVVRRWFNAMLQRASLRLAERFAD